PIASILTLRHKQALVYKYGCSDTRFHNMGGMPLLFWRTIEEAKSEGLGEFDLGRSDEKNAGLIQFKDHLGATKTLIGYLRAPKRAYKKIGSRETFQSPIIRDVLSRLPDSLFRLAGQMFYRHAG